MKDIEKMQPEISFIVPVYNVADYLPQCLESLLAVPVCKEIILVDDGSTDGSAQIAQAFFRLHSEIILLQQHNSGVSAARNRGLSVARGRYVQFVDGDDFLLAQTRYPELIAYADARQIDVVKTLILGTKQDGTPFLARLPTVSIGSDKDGVICSGEDYLRTFLGNWFPAIWNGFCRTEILRQHHIQFEETIRNSEDAIFTVDLLSVPDIRVLEAKVVTYAYRHRDNSASHNDWVRIFGRVCEAAQIIGKRAQRFAADSPMFDLLMSVMTLEYLIAYDRYYRTFNAEQRALVWHYFLPDVVDLMRKRSTMLIEL
ncbi:glycosyltransferase [Kingella negevensis]|uniref:glycosyltransferase n=1 Tax=Kingella negevensis TaxID=1522312 RepID=UPI002542C664|nr:glycosyltransferase [Kingella negevensis]WII94293.1 glycosyltransferase [Kingella negevensis]